MMSDPTDPNAPDGGPAFPLYLGVYASTAPPHIKGMSLRDYFAGQVLTGLMANPERYKFIDNQIEAQGLTHNEAIAKNANKAYLIADAMLKIRKETKP